MRLDVYDGRLRFDRGKWQSGALVNASTYEYRWEITGPTTCEVVVEEWIAETAVYPAGSTVTFTSPYAGTLSVDLMMHGRLATYDGVVVEDIECSPDMEPNFVEDLGTVPFSATADWTSVVTFRGKKLETVRTTVEYGSISLGDWDLVPDPDGESTACSWPRRMSVQAFDFIDGR
jgi:hypothetical protein